MAVNPNWADQNVLRCWRHQDCRACLDEDRCSWCPFVSRLGTTLNKAANCSRELIVLTYSRPGPVCRTITVSPHLHQHMIKMSARIGPSVGSFGRGHWDVRSRPSPVLRLSSPSYQRYSLHSLLPFYLSPSGRCADITGDGNQGGGSSGDGTGRHRLRASNSGRRTKYKARQHRNRYSGHEHG